MYFDHSYHDCNNFSYTKCPNQIENIAPNHLNHLNHLQYTNRNKLLCLQVAYSDAVIINYPK